MVTIVPGAIRHPSWSADGKQVVYERILQPASTEHLIPTQSRDPEFELLLSEPFPSFLPDGKKLLYSQYGSNGRNTGDTTIEIMNADGSGKQALFIPSSPASIGMVWSGQTGWIRSRSSGQSGRRQLSVTDSMAATRGPAVGLPRPGEPITCVSTSHSAATRSPRAALRESWRSRRRTQDIGPASACNDGPG